MDSTVRHNLSLKNLLITGIVGWIVSLYTLWHRSKVLAGLEIGQSFCNISSTINCDNVALSNYSQFFGISVPTFGLIFFTIVSLLAMRALGQFRELKKVGTTTLKLLGISAIVGVVSSLILGTISLTQIGSFCLVCGIVYALSIWNLILVMKIKKLFSSELRTSDILSTSSMFIMGVAIVLQFAFQPIADFAAKSAQSQENDLPEEFVSQLKQQFQAETQYEVPLQKSPFVGPENAPIKLVEFSDFQCPHCAHNFETLATTLSPFKDKVQLIYKNFPLDPACNSGGSHRNACFAARAARCVFKLKDLSAFKVMQKYLFTNRESFTIDSVKNKAKDLGLSESDFKNCVDSPETTAEIKEEIDLAKSIGVTGTPALFLNGRFVKAGTNSSALKALIQSELKK